MFFALLTTAGILTAQDSFRSMEATAGFKQKLNEASASIQTLKGNFTQEKYIDLLEEKMLSEGMFSYKKDNKIRFDYTLPEAYLLVINEQTVKIVSGEKTNVYDLKKNKTMVQMNLLMNACLTGNIDRLNVEYRLLFYENGTQYRVQIQPKANNLTIKQMDIFLDKKDFSVRQLKITETSNDYTAYSFSAPQKNTPIADSQFNIGKP
jgi:outer membrane lipoprotein-sorting protein